MSIAFGTLVKQESPGYLFDSAPGAAAHDVIILATVNDSGSAITYTWPASFDELANQICTNDGMGAGVARKKDASGAEGALAVTDSLTTSKTMATVTFSGVDNTTPEDTTVNVVNNNTATASPWTIDSGSITPVTPGAKIVAILFSDGAFTPVTGSFSTVSGSTGAWTVHDATISDGSDRNMAIASADWMSGSVVVRGTGTAAAASAGRSMVVIVLRPAGGGSSSVLAVTPLAQRNRRTSGRRM